MSYLAIWNRDTKELMTIVDYNDAPVSSVIVEAKCGVTTFDTFPTGKWNKETMIFDPWPTEKRLVSKLEFRNLFTLNEKVFWANTEANPNLNETQKDIFRVFREDLDAAGDTIDLLSPIITQGLMFLYSTGMITQERMVEIASGTPPSATPPSA